MRRNFIIFKMPHPSSDDTLVPWSVEFDENWPMRFIRYKPPKSNSIIKLNFATASDP